jgi:ABC-type phosphate transport system auxiliary subunit
MTPSEWYGLAGTLMTAVGLSYTIARGMTAAINRRIDGCQEKLERLRTKHDALEIDLRANYPSGAAIDRLRSEVKEDFRLVFARLESVQTTLAEWRGRRSAERDGHRDD